MAKSFISILGASDYLECRHKFNEIITETPVKYSQEDIAKLICKDFGPEDEIRIFLTEKAKEKNWENDSHGKPNKGLKTRLNELNLKCKIKTYIIKEGKDENEIWEIFETIYNSFTDNEIVYVDITHSFRYLLMLLTIILNFPDIKKYKYTRDILRSI